MVCELMLLALVGLYAILPSGDTSGIPYPTTKEAMREEIRRLEAWLNESKYAFELLEVHRDVMLQNSFFSRQTYRVHQEYMKFYTARHNAECRIDNIKKLLEKYEEIDAAYGYNGPPQVGRAT